MRATLHPVRRRTLRAICCAAALTLASSNLSAQTFTNPINGNGADPWVTQWQGQ